MPVILELKQHGNHLGLEYLRIIGCRQPSGKGVHAGFGLEERRAMAYHVEPCGTSIRGCIGHQLCGDHGRPVGCEHRTICQFKVQQPIILGVLDFLLSQVHQEFPVRAFHKHAVSRGERVMVQRNQFDVLQLRQGCRWTDQPLDIVDVFVLLVFPKDDAPVFTGTVEPCGQQFGNLGRDHSLPFISIVVGKHVSGGPSSTHSSDQSGIRHAPDDALRLTLLNAQHLGDVLDAKFMPYTQCVKNRCPLLICRLDFIVSDGLAAGVGFPS